MASTSTASRRCSRSGCRAWAVRGASLCVAHRGDAVAGAHNSERSDERQQRSDRFSELVQTGKHAELIDAALQAALSACASERSLAIEIGSLRLMLQRLVATDLLDGNPRDVTQAMTRLVDSIIRALRMEQTLATTFEDELRASMARVFRENGWEEIE